MATFHLDFKGSLNTKFIHVFASIHLYFKDIKFNLVLKIFDSITSFPLDFKDIWFIGYISSWFKSKLHYFFISKVFWFNTLLNFILISKTFGSLWFEIYLLYLRLKDICFISELTIFASIFHFLLVFKKFGSTITYISSLL